MDLISRVFEKVKFREDLISRIIGKVKFRGDLISRIFTDFSREIKSSRNLIPAKFNPNKVL